MSDLNKELAKIHLEQKGFLTSIDVQMEEEGFDAPGFDILGVDIKNGAVSKTVVGLVRGWWHAGSYLTPGLIRAHLETDRGFLSEYFSEERLKYIRQKFGLGTAPIYCILFYSQRSPKKSDEAQRILNSMGIDVVYIEDIIVDVLPQVGNIALGDGIASQLLPMVRFSRLFREMRKAAKVARQCRDEQETRHKVGEKKKETKKVKAEKAQLDFMKAFLATEEDDGYQE